MDILFWIFVTMNLRQKCGKTKRTILLPVNEHDLSERIRQRIPKRMLRLTRCRLLCGRIGLVAVIVLQKQSRVDISVPEICRIYRTICLITRYTDVLYGSSTDAVSP